MPISVDRPTLRNDVRSATPTDRSNASSPNSNDSDNE